MHEHEHESFWRRQLAVYRYDLHRWRERLPWQRTGRPVQPIRVRGHAIAPWVIGFVVGAIVIAATITTIAERFAR